MTQLLQQSEATAARRRMFFYLVDATDNETPETAIAIASGELQLSKNGAAFADGAGTWTHVAAGVYQYEATAAELDTVGVLIVKVVDSAANIVIKEFQVVPWDPYAADWALATSLAAAQTDLDTVQASTPDLIRTGPHAMGTLAANGNSTALSMAHAYDADITVTGTWGGGTATVQVCADVTATVPVWTTYDDGSGPNPLTANGTVVVTGAYQGVRVNLAGATNPSLVVVANMRRRPGAGA